MKSLIRKISSILIVVMILSIAFGCTPKEKPAVEEKLSIDSGYLSEINTEDGKNYITIATNEENLKLEVMDENLVASLTINDYYMVAFNQDNIVKSIEVKPFIGHVVSKYLEPNEEPKGTTIEASDKVDYNDLTLLDSMKIDFDKDGIEEAIELYTAAERYNGEIAWDDGQNWMLVVKDTDKDFVLFDDFVQLGGISFYAYFEDEDFVVTKIQSGTASLTLTEYRFDKDSNNFVVTEKFAAKGNVNMFHHAPLRY